MTAIYKRELCSYFNSMIGWVFVSVLTVFIGIYFFVNNLFAGYPYFANSLGSTLFVFMVLIPILTMRSLADERHSKTDQLLLTAPVSVTAVVMGKYLAMLTVFAVPVLIACLCPLIIAVNGTAFLLTDYCALFAFFLLGAVEIAVGMLISSLTESQIIAAVGTFGLLLLLFLWDDLVDFLPTTATGSVLGFLIALILVCFLINALSGEDRMIVSDVAGTTRDSVDVRFTKDGRDYIFVDTAGVRRRTRITDIVEKYSVNAAIKSTTKADVTLLTLDATEQVSQQDKRLMDLLDNRKIPFMVLINKCDLVPAGALRQLEKNVRQMLAFCGHVPILPVSALTGKGLEKILPLARTIHEECGVRVPTGQLNRAMEDVLARHQPPVVKRVRAKFFYLTQAETQPPTFVFFVSDAERVPESYARYLERSLRKIFGISHAPMRIRLRSSHKKDKK